MPQKVLHSVTLGRQISVFLEDRPGTLADITQMLGEHDVNIHALSLAEGLGHGYVRMVVDKPDAAIAVLREADELAMEREVLLLELSNLPGSLAKATRKLAEAGINLQYAYCAAGPGVDKGLVVVKVDDTAGALKVLRAFVRVA